MSNTKFTPGPWRAAKGNHQMTWPDETTVVHIFYGEDAVDSWFILSEAENHGHEEANAKLIASAPELLEALENLVANVKTLDDIRELPIMSRLLKISDEAIKKATE